MATFTFKLPDVGEGIAEAEITAWHVAVGDTIEEDQALVDVMTDKATVEIPSPVAGKVLSLHGETGDKRPVGAELVVIETAAEASGTPEPEAEPEVAPEQPAKKERRRRSGRGQPAPPPEQAEAEPAPPLQGKALAAPAVRRRARDLGIDLASVTGSGPAGRVTHSDLDARLAAAPVAGQGSGPDEVEEVKVIGLRRMIAERMQAAKRRIPHFSYVEEVDVTALEELRRHLNENRAPDRPTLSPLPFLMRALAKALPHWPQINAHFDDDAGIVHRHRAVHIGIATQTEAGLLVPVVRHAEARDLWSCAAEVTRLAAAARAGKAARDELAGSTITITSLGAIGGIASTPVINRPEVAIVGVNKIQERPVIYAGRITARRMMNLSSSFDHRVVDGWHAAEFIQRVKALLEQPATLFMG